ncbi:MAG: hypothetical protein JO232_11950 [Verrucomicrobia bacterium]|nr:hypothetical protein [Verrucomicrobiota bacterium]
MATRDWQISPAFWPPQLRSFFRILGIVILGVLVVFLGLRALVGLVYVVYLIYAMAGGDFQDCDGTLAR